jgi:transglutaminase-like putative cysteine protease
LDYDVRLRLSYDYDAPVGGGRHLLRVMPRTLPGLQRVVAATVEVRPKPSERSDGTDFFGNPLTTVAFREAHDELDVRMSARVAVNRPAPGIDLSPLPGRLADEIASVHSLSPEAPHHFLAASPSVELDPAITAWAREIVAADTSVAALAEALCTRIHTGFAYDGDATTVSTRAAEAFRLRRGVCQDFSHVMIAGLRGLGVPAAYVSGFLRTTPPPGEERLEGADAMHAWVRVWCGRDMGWLEWDPTNGIRVGNGHIVAGYGRDYGDVAPIVGIVKSNARQVIGHAVDVVPVE